ncbi:carboxylesterase family domain-containing protein [Phthorimaea operculella]|nr:carboxylesterase family domain-containing protein [Phthorimaea operculella]
MTRALCYALCALLAIANVHSSGGPCDARLRTEAGLVCGLRRQTSSGFQYASFRGVPYAQPPFGPLRFEELQPLEPWKDTLDATKPGHVCPQEDVFYGPLMTPTGMSEYCIFANVHVPHYALPSMTNQGRAARQVLRPPKRYSNIAGEVISSPKEVTSSKGLPILVFVHGGGFAFGSGDDDVHGPDHFVEKGVIVITFNYRLNVFGFLSLNTTKVPGNAGLRDMITLLRWVQDNAKNFGGNPDDVTLAGESAGASAVHLLTLSPLVKGLFHKAIIMSGTALPLFYTTSPAFAKYAADSFLKALNITATDPDEIHQQLAQMPLDAIMAVNKALQDASGIAFFFPVIESPLPGVEAVLPEDTQTLLKNGRGSDIPLLIGMTNMEAESFRKRFSEIDIVERVKKLPTLVLSPQVLFSVAPDIALERAKEVSGKYFANGIPTMDEYLKLSSEQYFQYPALKVAEYRAKTGNNNTYMYEFAYNSDDNPVRRALGLNYTGGAGHVEDMTYMFNVNSVKVPRNSEDEQMKHLMNDYVVNFIKTGAPTTSGSWAPISNSKVAHWKITSPKDTVLMRPTTKQDEMVRFFDDIRASVAPTWTGIREASTTSCSPTSEVAECLHLDVHVPAAGTGPWPVLVWVRSSNAQYQPRKLVQQGVIVVVVYHRMGPMGFICLREEQVPGNAGAKDVVLALRWVRDNIVAFKGNSAKVVVAGHGLGAAIVEATTLSPMAQGLYHGVIMQSGTVLSPLNFNFDAVDRADALAVMIGDEDDRATSLLNADIAELVEDSARLDKPYFPFGLCIEKAYKKEERFLHESPIDMLKLKKVHPVPMIIGYNSDEAYIFILNIKGARVRRRISDDTRFLLPEELKFFNEKEAAQVAKQIKDSYFKGNNSMGAVLAYHRDAYFLNHIYRSARLHASATNMPVYFYQFSHSGNVGVYPDEGDEKKGAAHSDELAYLFSGRDLDGDDGMVQQKLAKLWTNFAKYLTPTPHVAGSSTWEPLTSHNPRMLNIGAELKMEQFPHAKKMHLWDDIYEKYYFSRFQNAQT